MIGETASVVDEETVVADDHIPIGSRIVARLLVAIAALMMTWAAPAPAHPPLKASLAELEARLASTPEDAASLAARGELRRLLGDGDGAEADLATALALDPELVDAELYRARLFRELHRPADAAAAATAYLEAGPAKATQRATAFVVRSRARRDLRDLGAALSDLDQALAALQQPIPELILERVDLLQLILAGRQPPVTRQEQIQMLIAALDEGIALLGPTASLQMPAIDFEVDLGNVESALARLDTLQGQADRQDGWLEWRGEILLAAGRLPEASAAFAAALRELDRRSTTRRTARATAARRDRLEARRSELVAVTPTEWRASPPSRQPKMAVPVAPAAEQASAASSALLTRGPYLQLATDNSIVVRWRTDVASSSRVAWGASPGNLDAQIVDSDEVTEHELTVDGLDSDTCYVYEIGTETTVLAGGDLEHLMCTAPAADSSIRVWVIGDSGTADANAAAVRDAYLGFFSDPRPDVWLMLGDNAYPDGTESQYQAAVFDMYPTILAHAVVWPTFGNHDAVSSDSATQTGPYFDSFTLPTGGEAGGMTSGTEAYYSFDHGPVHFICLDSAGFRTPTTAMLDWLTADLMSTGRQWIVVYFHHPPYTKGSHDSDDPGDSSGRMFAMREIVVPMLENHGVDLVLAGHSHSYERSVQLDGHYGTSDTLTPEMIVDGGDGSPLGDGAYRKGHGPRQGAVFAVAGSSGKLGGGPLDHPVMHIALNELGSMVLLIDPGAIEATFLDSGAEPDDLFRVEKESGRIFFDGFEIGDASRWSDALP